MLAKMKAVLLALLVALMASSCATPPRYDDRMGDFVSNIAAVSPSDSARVG